MSFTKIPVELVRKIPDIHALSVSMALKIVQLTNHNKNIYKIMVDIAPEIGKSITSPAKLDRTVRVLLKGENRDQGPISTAAKVFTSDSGKKLFTFKDQKGSPCIVFHKDSSSSINFDHLCEQLRTYLETEAENRVSKSGAPDLIIN